MKDLAQVIEMELRKASLMGNRLSRRRMIRIAPDGTAWLVLGWRNDAGLARVHEGDDPHIDASDLPDGVEISVWRAPADTVTQIAPPGEQDIRDAMRLMLQCDWIDRCDSADGWRVYMGIARETGGKDRSCL